MRNGEKSKLFIEKTPSEVLGESGLKSYWLGVLVKGEDKYGVKIRAKNTARGYWYVELFHDGKCVESIPFPSISHSRATNKDCIELFLGYARELEEGASFDLTEIGIRHEEFVNKKSAKKVTEETKKEGKNPWSDFDRDLDLKIKAIKRIRYKTALQERQLSMLEARRKASPNKWLVGMGVGYRVSVRQINRGFRISKTCREQKQVLLTCVADTGLTTSGGDYDVIQDRWVYIDQLVRDKKFDSNEVFSI